MSKEISMYKINKIKGCLSRIFLEEDEDVPNHYVISANERAIDKYLEDYSKDEYDELLSNIRWSNDNSSKALEKLGWNIKRGVGK